MRAAAAALAALGATIALATAVQAQDYPTRPITWIVPFLPGGVSDLASRTVAKRLGEMLGQPVVVEYRPGAGGSLGTDHAARTAPDGYTLLYATSGTLAANLALYKQLRYRPLVDFAPVHGLFQSSTLLVVHASQPFMTLADLVRYARQAPGTLSYGSAGVGTGTHLAGAQLQVSAGVEMNHVPYKGSAAALTDLLGGRLHLMFDYAPAILPHIRSGRLRALAVMGRLRSRALPDVPTIAESGYPAAELGSWSGIVVPAGTPGPVVDKLSQAVKQVLMDPVLMAPFEHADSVPLEGMGPQAFRVHVADEIRRWAEVVRITGVTLE